MSKTKKLSEATLLATLPDGAYIAIVDPSGTIGRVTVSALKDSVRESIRIGGRNYVLDSRDYGAAQTSGTYLGLKVVTTSKSWDDKTTVALALSQPIPPGEKYILSFYAKCPTMFYEHSSRSYITSLGEDWHRYQIPVTFTAETSSVRIVLGTGHTGPLSVCGVKLERGNIATDWTPAPEDLMQEISSSGGGNALHTNHIRIIAERRAA